MASRSVSGSQFLPERLAQPFQVRRALVALPSQLRGLDLGDCHRLARPPQLALQTELLLGALAKLRRDV